MSNFNLNPNRPDLEEKASTWVSHPINCPLERFWICRDNDEVVAEHGEFTDQKGVVSVRQSDCVRITTYVRGN